MSRSACRSWSLVNSRIDGLFEPLPLSCLWPLSSAGFFFGAAMGNSVLKRVIPLYPNLFGLKRIALRRRIRDAAVQRLVPSFRRLVQARTRKSRASLRAGFITSGFRVRAKTRAGMPERARLRVLAARLRPRFAGCPRDIAGAVER